MRSLWVWGIVGLLSTLAYAPVSNAELVYVKSTELSRDENAVIENVSGALVPIVNEMIVNFPRVNVMGAKCGQPNAFYVREAPGGPAIVICTELFSMLVQNARSLNRTPEEMERIVGAQLLFIFFHEVGHALIDQLDLPALGREEDAADQFATLMLESEPFLVLNALAFFLSGTRGTAPPTASAFAGEHSLNDQRIYSMLCWAYGADPLVRYPLARLIPENRRMRCANETNDVTRAWTRLLGSHLAAPWGTVENRRGAPGTWRFTEQLATSDGNARCTASGTLTVHPFGEHGEMAQVGTCVHLVSGPQDNTTTSAVSEVTTTENGFTFIAGDCHYTATYVDASRLAVVGPVRCGSVNGDFYATR